MRKSSDFLTHKLRQYGSGKRVLAYCCGDGVLTFKMAAYADQVVGIDISDVSIQSAREKAQQAGLNNLTFEVMDAERTTFPDGSFDLIVASGVLHHLDLNYAYPELARLLASEGYVICGEPLIHNPVFQAYRRRTPHLRTAWETEHILSRSMVMQSLEYFEQIELYFFNLATLIAVPFRGLPGFNPLLSILEKIDSVLLRLPAIKWQAWMVFFILSKPRR